tara:strand:- start:339 stop:653 length:315 start_codon:yes stop_codon:yes gene_type:complete
MPFKEIIKGSKKFLDEPHEKIISNIFNIILFSFIYYYLYKKDKNSFKVSEDLLKDKTELSYYDILYYSLLLNFTISFGDMVPLSSDVKVVSSIQTFLFWYIALY